MNVRQKGARVERELAAFLRALGFANADRAARIGKDGGEDITLDAIPGVWIECKGVEKLNVEEAMQQAEQASPAATTPCVMHKRNRTEWCVTLRLKSVGFFARAIIKELERVTMETKL